MRNVISNSDSEGSISRKRVAQLPQRREPRGCRYSLLTSERNALGVSKRLQFRIRDLSD